MLRDQSGLRITVIEYKGQNSAVRSGVGGGWGGGKGAEHRATIRRDQVRQTGVDLLVPRGGAGASGIE